MASSNSMNLSNESDNQHNKSNQISKPFDERKKILPTSWLNTEETIEEDSVQLIKRPGIEQQNDLSPHLIQKQFHTPLTARCISSNSICTRSERANIAPCARPFEEFLIDQSSTNMSSGTSTKPGDSKSSSTTKSA